MLRVVVCLSGERRADVYGRLGRSESWLTWLERAERALESARERQRRGVRALWAVPQ